MLKNLRCLDRWNNARLTVADLYKKNLPDVVNMQKSIPGSSHVYHLLEIYCGAEHRDSLMGYLKKNGIGCGLHYPISCHKQLPYVKEVTYMLPITEDLSKSLLSLPMYPTLKKEEVLYVCEKINDFFESE